MRSTVQYGSNASSIESAAPLTSPQLHLHAIDSPPSANNNNNNRNSGSVPAPASMMDRRGEMDQHSYNSNMERGGGGGNNSGSSAGGGGGNDGDHSDGGGGGGKDTSGRPPFTMHGVLHYLQHEWSRYEMERSQWELERAELRARISFLVGERTGQENLKHDLVRRIKMLEYALKQERVRNRQLSSHPSNGVLEDESEEPMEEPLAVAGDLSSVPMDIDVVERDPASDKDANGPAWKEARQLLKQYLQEIGYSDKLLDIKSFRVRNLLGGFMPTPGDNGDARKAAERALRDSEQVILDTADIIKQSRKQDPTAGGKDSETGGGGGGGFLDDDSDSSDGDDKNLDSDAIEALDEFSFLKQEEGAGDEPSKPTPPSVGGKVAPPLPPHPPSKRPSAPQVGSGGGGGGGGPGKWTSYGQTSFEQVKEEFRRTMEDRRKLHQQGQSLDATVAGGGKGGRSPQEAALLRMLDGGRKPIPGGQRAGMRPQGPAPTPSGTGQPHSYGNPGSGCSDEEDSSQLSAVFAPRGKGDATPLDVNVALGLSPDEVVDDLKEDFIGAAAGTDLEEQLASQQKWNIKFTLRSHYDSIRAMQFHPVEPVLITASEDGTAKLWDLATATVPGGAAGMGGGKQTQHGSNVGVVDIEPIYTFRGHRGPILAMDITPTGDMCFTAGQDGSICCWLVPPTNVEVYSTYDPTILQERILNAHPDCIWSLAYHSSTNRLISASADGTIKLWELGVALEGMQSLVKTFPAPDAGLRPRSIDIVSVDPQQLLTAYSKSHCAILDLETGKCVLNFELQKSGEAGEVGEVNKILSHPTMPVTVMAGEDRRIRYFDNNTGKLIHGGVAHVEAISSLAIDPNGLYLLSGSHDGSLRLWNMEKRICLQEIAAHRKKYDMSVMAVAFHSSRPLIGSAGADALAKVFGLSGRGMSSSSPSLSDE